MANLDRYSKKYYTSTGQNVGCLINKSYSIDVVVMGVNSQGSGLSKSIVDVYVTIIGPTQNFVTICAENNGDINSLEFRINMTFPYLFSKVLMSKKKNLFIRKVLVI